MTQTLVNGVPVAAVAADDRGLAYGDGLFETIAWRAGGLRFAGRHWERLRSGSERLGLPAPPLDAIEHDLAALAPASDGVVKVVWTRGAGPRGYSPPAEPRPTRIVSFAPGGAPAERSWTAVSLRSPASTNTGLAGLKSLNRLDNVLARRELAGHGANEGLMLDAHGHLVGGTSSNLFIVTGERIETPDLMAAGIRGIMRAEVIAAAESLGIPVRESTVEPAALHSADAVFVTNALIGVRPLERVDGTAYPSPDHPLVRAIMAELLARGVGECSQD